MQQSAGMRMRMRMRPWLEEQINSGVYPGVKWLDLTDRVFQIPWKHAARHGWSINRDATLFRGWAMHTGKYCPGRDPPDPKTWKANFRCALNSLSDVKELSDRSQKKGSHAYRVYRMLPDTHTHPRRRRRRRKRDRFRGVTDAHTHTFYLSTSTPHSASSTGTQHGSSVPRQNDGTPCTPHNPCWPPEETPYSYGSVKEDCPSDSNTQQVHYATASALGPGGESRAGGEQRVTKHEQEQEEAVFKLVDHLNTSELWFNEDQRGLRTHPVWEHCYGGDSDCLTFPMQTDHYTPTAQQTLLLLDNVTATPAPIGQ